MSKNTSEADIGLIGLAVMGQNLVLNMADHGFKVAVYNRTTETMDRFVAEHPDTPGGLVACRTLKALVGTLSRPRKCVLLVKAGSAVDTVISQLVGLLGRGDIVVDGGNSQWTDTIRRERQLAAKGLYFVGSGVSGGEVGARFGPSLMPGGTKEAWNHLRPIFNAIAAKVDRKTGQQRTGGAPGKPVRGGVPCAAHIGPNGAGHYVKMIHNGIEYADMQLICEAYLLMKEVGRMKPGAISKVFAEWNRGDLNSFLIEITADILQQRDPTNRRRYLVDVILDRAGQKGTGKWTSVNALNMGVAAPSIAEAVFARFMSAIKPQRVTASRSLKGPRRTERGSGPLIKSQRKLIEAIHDALYASKICCYAQGFALMAEAQPVYEWKLDFGRIAMIWRGGCIIRAGFLQKITDAYDRDPKLGNLLLDPYFGRKIRAAQANWRKVVAAAARYGAAVPQTMSALAYYDSYRSAWLPANLLQAQRDYFGAHTFQRTDQPADRHFHVDWLDPDRPQQQV